MIKSVKISNFGPIETLDWKSLGRINLVVGANGSGKTFLLKGLYTSIKSVEAYRRGDDQRRLSEILADKLYWTFQSEKLGDLVKKDSSSKLSFETRMTEGVMGFSFGRDTTKTILEPKETIGPRSANSIFLPAKEVISLHRIILKSRDQDQLFGFDDTYVDLARVLMNATQMGKNYLEFKQSREILREIIGGKIEFDEKNSRWSYYRGSTRYSIGVTAEGVKKIAILDILLGNRFITPESIIFIDEPESALHPAAISRFLDIIATLAERGIQFFLATHSYFVVKKLHLIAKEKGWPIPLASFDSEDLGISDLNDGIPPHNAIISESIKLYEQEVEWAYK